MLSPFSRNARKTGPAKARAFVLASAILSSGLVIMACFGNGPLAGGGSGIENPDLILAFRDRDGSPVRVTGRLRLFPERSGWRDSSLYARTLDGQDTAMVTSRDLQALPPGTLPSDSRSPDSTLGLNVVISGDGLEGMLGGFRLRGDGSRGYTLAGSDSAGKNGSRADVVLSPPARSYSGSIPAEYMGKGFRVVFVPGSPYFSLVNLDGSLLFPILPQGTFPVRAAAFSPLSDTLITFYCTPDSLRTDSPFVPGRWESCPP
jgi:hypothetical protein